MRAILFVVCITAVAQTITVQSGGSNAPPPSPVLRERAPDQVPRLPVQVRTDLIAKRCKLPVYGGTYGLTSAYSSGHFHDRTTLDWAVVCHIPNRHVQDVFVYMSGPDGWKPERLEHGVFGPPGVAAECEESVNAATPAAIRYYDNELDGGKEHLPPLDHDGVEIGYCEKASTIYFNRAGHWLTLDGSD